MVTERLPKAGSMEETVFHYLREHGTTATRVIAEATGLEFEQARSARNRLFRYGYRAATIEEWRESVSIGKGTILPDIKFYAEIRMTPREIGYALEYEGRSTFPLKRIENALNKAWRRGKLPKRAEREI